MKLRQKSIIFGILLILTASLLTGCGHNKAEQAVISELELIKQLDEETIRSFVSYEDIMSSEARTSNIGEETTEAVHLFFKNFDYKIISSRISGNSATVKVRITNLDMKSLAHGLCLALLSRSADPRSTPDPLDMNGYFSLLGDMLKSNSYKILTTDALFELTLLPDGTWSIQNNNSLEDQLVGGFITYLNDPYLVTPEEVLSLTFDYFQDFSAWDWISYLDMDDIFQTGSDLADDLDYGLASQIARYFNYQINRSNVSGDQATVNVTITSLDLTGILGDYREKLLSYASTSDAIRATDDELAEKTAQILCACLNANDSSLSHSLDISLINNGSSWEILLDESFTDAVLGNTDSALAALSGEAAPETEIP